MSTKPISLRPAHADDPHRRWWKLPITRRGRLRVAWCLLAHQRRDITIVADTANHWRTEHAHNRFTGDDAVVVLPVDTITVRCVSCARPVEAFEAWRLDLAERVNADGTTEPL